MDGNAKHIDRFNHRADNYDKYRPGYPQALLSFIHDHAAIGTSSSLAEIGAGTGILSRELAKWNCLLYAIEPNEEMRQIAEHKLQAYRNCEVKNATAEATTLADSSVDLVICAQSFHWFDFDKVKAEFQRILKEEGMVAIIWNIRSAETEFEKAYEQFILRFSIDYKEVKRRESRGKNLHLFFGEESFDYRLFIYDTYLTFDQLLGRTFSYSYMPNKDDEQAPFLIKELTQLFDVYQTNGLISLSYKSKLYIGKL